MRLSKRPDLSQLIQTYCQSEIFAITISENLEVLARKSQVSANPK
ncbi:hypothetical protein AMC99_00766 [Altererythrobacter epoxidivorans]|uniref:Uncharacterized protein n=1 Tax=Altererythrobacter epoxidivorans TaxID=361183 RepID=A0A0M5L6L5_9SPHN|nr:hypothetical protein AMC99_00766 [Altererythrobacter epoxidivorans]